jgi:predicted PurR-regulated permease PerM
MVAMPGRASRIVVPRWIQLAALPVLLFFLWLLAGQVFHVLFLFLVAALAALLLNPVVRALERVKIPRGLSVALVYLAFAAAIIVAIAALGTVAVDQTRTAANRVNAYFTVTHGRSGITSADRDVNRLQHWFDTHGLRSIHVQKRGHDLVKKIRQKDIGKYTHRVVSFIEGAAISVGRLIFDLVLIIVVSIYMLLDLRRLRNAVDRRFPPEPGGESLVVAIERALASYVKGQLLLSLIIGVSAGIGIWLLGITGLLPGGERYALIFGGWAALTELVPYLGPWLGAVPPFIYALVVHPISAVWVAVLFLFIHQIEGHVVVPNVMGSALRLHPLLVIFGLLAGGELYGLPGILVVLPFLAVCRATWEFFSPRVVFESWRPQPAEPVPLEVGLEPEPEAVASEPPAGAPR